MTVAGTFAAIDHAISMHDRGPNAATPRCDGGSCQTQVVRILRSALKHGCTAADITHEIASSWRRVQVGADPDKWLYVGVDGAARPLEIVTVAGMMEQSSSSMR